MTDRYKKQIFRRYRIRNYRYNIINITKILMDIHMRLHLICRFYYRKSPMSKLFLKKIEAGFFGDFNPFETMV